MWSSCLFRILHHLPNRDTTEISAGHSISQIRWSFNLHNPEIPNQFLPHGKILVSTKSKVLLFSTLVKRNWFESLRKMGHSCDVAHFGQQCMTMQLKFAHCLFQVTLMFISGFCHLRYVVSVLTCLNGSNGLCFGT